MKFFAKFLSVIFSSLSVAVVLFICLTFVFHPPWQVWSMWIGLIVVSAFFLWWGIRQGMFSDIDISKRAQRLPFLTVVTIGSLLSLISIYFWGSAPLFSYGIIISVWLVLFTIITYFWKISGHTSMATLVFLLLDALFGWRLNLLFIFIPLIAWARVYEHHHTVAQTVVGVMLSLCIGFGGVALFGLW